MKHKKTSVLKMKDDVQGELSLHHEFNPSTATTIVRMVQDIEEYLLKVCSPLQTEWCLRIFSLEKCDQCCSRQVVMLYHWGNAAYAKFINNQLRKIVFNILNYK